MWHFLFHGCSSSPWRKHQVYSTFHSMKWLLWCCDMKFVWARMLSFLLMLNTFGYGPELFWIRIWICLMFSDTFWILMATSILDTQDFLDAAFWGYFLILLLFGLHQTLQQKNKKPKLILDTFGRLWRATCARRAQFPNKSEKMATSTRDPMTRCVKWDLRAGFLATRRTLGNLRQLCWRTANGICQHANNCLR